MAKRPQKLNLNLDYSLDDDIDVLEKPKSKKEFNLNLGYSSPTAEQHQQTDPETDFLVDTERMLKSGDPRLVNNGITNLTEHIKSKPIDPISEADKINPMMITPGLSPTTERMQKPSAEMIGDVVQGAASIPSGVAEFADMLGVEGGHKLANEINDWSAQYASKDPNYVNKLLSGAGSMAAFMIPGAGAVGVTRILSFTPKIAKALQIGIPTILEAITESGGTRNEMLNEGFSEDEANKAATISAIANTLTIGITNKLGIFGEGQKAVHYAITSGLEGSQELLQNITDKLVQSKQIDPKELFEDFSLGAIIGVGAKKTFGQQKTEVEEKPSNNKYRDRVNDNAVRESLNPENAQVRIEDTKNQQVGDIINLPEDSKQTEEILENEETGQKASLPKETPTNEVVQDAEGTGQKKDEGVSEESGLEELLGDVAGRFVVEKKKDGTYLATDQITNNTVRTGALTDINQLAEELKKYNKRNPPENYDWKKTEDVDQNEKKKQDQLIDEFFELRDFRAKKGNKDRNGFDRLREIGKELQQLGINANVGIGDKLFIDGKQFNKPRLKTEKVNIEDVEITHPEAKESFEKMPNEEVDRQTFMAEMFAEKKYLPENLKSLLPTGFGQKKIDKGVSDIKHDAGKEQSKEAQIVRDFTKELDGQLEANGYFTLSSGQQVTKDELDVMLDEYIEEKSKQQSGKEDVSFEFGESAKKDKPLSLPELKNTKQRLDEKKTHPGGLTKAESKILSRVNKAIENFKSPVEKTKAGEQLYFGKISALEEKKPKKDIGEKGSPLFEQKEEDKNQIEAFNESKIDEVLKKKIIGRLKRGDSVNLIKNLYDVSAEEVEKLKKEIPQEEIKKPDKTAKASKEDSRIPRFLKMAETLEKQITYKRREMTQNPTPKRMKEYQGRLWEADNFERGQKALKAIANGLENGTLPEILSEVKKKDEILGMVYKGLDHSHGYYEIVIKTEYSDTSPKAKALQELIDKKETATEREEKKRKERINQIEAGLVGNKIPGYFDTRGEALEQTIDLADIQKGDKVLEPSAGKGNIAEKVKEKGADVEVIEINHSLGELLELKGFSLVGYDFLEYGKGGYDKIVMNPPFEKMQDVEHIKHAYDLVKPGGRVVSIMGESPFFRSDKKAVEFRDWLEENDGYSDKLPEKSFMGPGGSRTTGVNTRVVVIEKPSRKITEESYSEAVENVSKLSSGIDPTQIKDYVTISAFHLENIIQKVKGEAKQFREFRQKLISEIGSWIKKYALKLFRKAKELLTKQYFNPNVLGSGGAFELFSEPVKPEDMVKRINKIDNPFELRNWKKKHQHEIDNLPDGRKKVVNSILANKARQFNKQTEYVEELFSDKRNQINREVTQQKNAKFYYDLLREFEEKGFGKTKLYEYLDIEVEQNPQDIKYGVFKPAQRGKDKNPIVRGTQQLIFDRSEQMTKQFYNFQQKMARLVKNARDSRGKIRVGKNDKWVFQYLEGQIKREQLTEEEKTLADFVNKFYQTAKPVMTDKGSRDNYATHIKRGFFEVWLDEGLGNAYKSLTGKLTDKELAKESEQKSSLQDEAAALASLDKVISDVKYNPFEQKREGVLEPTRNLLKIMDVYGKVYYIKKNFDSIRPMVKVLNDIFEDNKMIGSKTFLDGYIKRATEEGLGERTPEGIKKVVNGLMKWTSIRYLGFNLGAGVINTTAGMVDNLISQSFPKFLKGEKRFFNPKGQRIIKEQRVVDVEAYDAIKGIRHGVAKVFKTVLFMPMSGYGYLPFGEHYIQSTFYLGELTKEEFNSGKISQQRHREILERIGDIHGNYRDMLAPDAKSLTMYKPFLQFKLWMFSKARTRFERYISKEGVIIKTLKWEKSKHLNSAMKEITIVLSTSLLHLSDEDDILYNQIMDVLTDLYSPFLPDSWKWWVDTPAAMMKTAYDILIAAEATINQDVYKRNSKYGKKGDPKYPPKVLDLVPGRQHLKKGYSEIKGTEENQRKGGNKSFKKNFKKKFNKNFSKSFNEGFD